MTYWSRHEISGMIKVSSVDHDRLAFGAIFKYIVYLIEVFSPDWSFAMTLVHKKKKKPYWLDPVCSAGVACGTGGQGDTGFNPWIENLHEQRWHLQLNIASLLEI